MKNEKVTLEEFEEVVNPVKLWADKNLNPHQMIIIESGFAKIVSTEIGIVLKIQD